jgi:glycerate-2-kinase
LRRWLEEKTMLETPKPGDAAFRNSYFSLLLGMDDLFHPAHRAAESEGFVTCCDNTTDDWPVERAAENLVQQLEELRKINAGHRVALIADGEVSSPVTGNGIGEEIRRLYWLEWRRSRGKRWRCSARAPMGLMGTVRRLAPLQMAGRSNWRARMGWNQPMCSVEAMLTLFFRDLTTPS